jgi:hypothetical protein
MPFGISYYMDGISVRYVFFRFACVRGADEGGVVRSPCASWTSTTFICSRVGDCGCVQAGDIVTGCRLAGKESDSGSGYRYVVFPRTIPIFGAYTWDHFTVRLALGLLNATSLLAVSRQIRRKWGKQEQRIWILFSVGQFHACWWAGRTVPNVGAAVCSEYY